MSALADRFTALWAGAKLRDAGAVYAQLSAAHTEPARAYHNLSHIEHMLGEFDAQRALADWPEAVHLAIWFHDAVYDSRAKDNEERSAALAHEMLLNAGAHTRLVSAVELLILATRHQQPPHTRDEQLLVDCDLAILGQPTERFDAYETAIRKEYAWVPEADYRAGRAKVLTQFQARNAIYSLPAFRNRYEATARENLRRSIAKLNAGA